MKNAIIIFTRVPVPHYTKTRLEKFLTPYECANMHIKMLRDIIGVCKTTNEDIYVFFTPQKDKHQLITILGDSKNYVLQTGNDLGEKMYNAIKYICDKGYSKCILIGSDIPEISRDDILSAFSLLETSDVVFGPTFDGGYYLIGMKKPINEVFKNQLYGCGEVLSNAEKALDKSNLKYSLVSEKSDIDDPEDLISFFHRNCNKEVPFKNTFNYAQDLINCYKKNL